MKGLILSALILSPIVGFAQALLAPANLQGEFNASNHTIELSWEPSTSKVAGYNLFVKKDNNDFLLWGQAGLISATAYVFEIKNRNGNFYEFKVCAVQNFPKVVRSTYSNSIRVEVPSTFLPMVKLNKPTVKKKTTEITWDYESKAADLDGFIIYLDQQEIKAGKTDRKHILTELVSGKHIINIVAITKSGLRSAPSSKKIITIK